MLWFSVGIAQSVQVTILFLMGSRHINHHMMIRFTLEAVDMLPYQIDGCHVVKLGVQSEAILFSFVWLGEDPNNIASIKGLDIHIKAEILYHCKFHDILAVQDVIDPRYPVKIIYVNWFETKSETTKFEPLLE